MGGGGRGGGGGGGGPPCPPPAPRAFPVGGGPRRGVCVGCRGRGKGVEGGEVGCRGGVGRKDDKLGQSGGEKGGGVGGASGRAGAQVPNGGVVKISLPFSSTQSSEHCLGDFLGTLASFPMAASSTTLRVLREKPWKLLVCVIRRKSYLYSPRSIDGMLSL